MAHSVKKRALFQLSAETPLPWPLLPQLLLWPRCGDVCWSWPLFLVWVSEGLQANCALPKGLQQTVETLAPSHRPFHCVNICASGFSQEETEAQMSVLEGWSLQETGTWGQPFQKEYIPLLLSAPSQAAPSPEGGSSIRPGAAVVPCLPGCR